MQRLFNKIALLTRCGLILILLLLSINLQAQDSTLSRNYTIGGFNQYDLRNSSINAFTINKALHDGFRRNIKPKMKDKVGGIAYGIYSFATTYITMVWSHEFGHSLRAQQVGGAFKIHNGNLPIPYTTMHLPKEISYEDEALSVTGGFELNHLTAKKVQQDFIIQNGSYNEDLAYAFANRMMFNIYTSLIVPINPEDKNVWIETAGDPIHCILPIFKNYSNDKVFMLDSSINPDLVSFYKQSTLFGVLIGLLDPHFYSEVSATFGDPNEKRKPLFIIGNHQNGWTYGTMFNMSPLGYELYLNNYLHLNNNQFTVYSKYGNPFKNNGLGVRWNNMIDKKKLQLSSQIELWDQDIFGTGYSGEIESRFKAFEKISLDLSFGYKSKGYVLGKQIKKGVNAGFGIVYHATY